MWSGLTLVGSERDERNLQRPARPSSQVEEAGGAPHGVAHAAEVAALERAPGTLHHRSRRGRAARGHLMRRHDRLAVVVIGLQLSRRPPLGPGRDGDWSRLVERLRRGRAPPLGSRRDGDGCSGGVVVGEKRGQAGAGGEVMAGRRRRGGAAEAGGRGRRGRRRGGRGCRGRRGGGGGAGRRPDDVALVELLDAVVVGLLEQAEEAERRGGGGDPAVRWHG
jgi:hypothetical protein